MNNMNAETFGFAFATRVADPFGATSAIQETREAPIDKPTSRRRPARTTSTPSKLTAAATASLTESGLLELIEPSHNASDIVISSANYKALAEVVQENRRADDLRRHGLRPRSKLLFCGPPGCGKTLCAEVVSNELKLPLVVARLDAIITTYLGETATNLRKIFDAVSSTPAVLFLDEFDALARARTDASEHSEIRRVVNSLLMMIDRYAGRGLLIAATNLVDTIDDAAWRRFDDVLVFDPPGPGQIAAVLKIKLRNFPVDFAPSEFVNQLDGLSYADIERVCLHAIKRTILSNQSAVDRRTFLGAVDSERKRASIRGDKSSRP